MSLARGLIVRADIEVHMTLIWFRRRNSRSSPFWPDSAPTTSPSCKTPSSDPVSSETRTLIDRFQVLALNDPAAASALREFVESFLTNHGV